VVTLADREGHAVVRIGIDIGRTEVSPKNGFVPSPVPALRDMLLGAIARYESHELLAPEGKANLKRALLQALREQVPQAGAAELDFTEFLVQR
jgi:flagellar basal body-associated protein FliL